MTGKIILFVAVLLGAYAFFYFDVTAESMTGNTIINLGLMDERRNLLIISGVAAIIGVILMTRGNSHEKR